MSLEHEQDAIQRGVESAYSLAGLHAQQAAMSQHDNELEKGRPFIVYGARICRDGDQWCAILGDNLQVGVCGFGDSPAEAVAAFDKVWTEAITEVKK